MSLGITLTCAFIILVLAAMQGVMGFKVHIWVWILAWIGCFYTVLAHGFTVPIPASTVKIYMAIVSFCLFLYALSDPDKAEAFRGPVLALITDKKYNALVILILIALPLLAAGAAYQDLTRKVVPPPFGRSVHPAAPASVNFKGKVVDILKGENPFTALKEKDAGKYREHVENGKRVYYQNCFFCHGDRMEGAGIYAYGLDPKPTNFQDATLLPSLEESFLFWRVSKGGIGLPEEGGPWATAMPAWENFLSEDEIWEVILYLSEYTGFAARAKEHHGAGH